MILDNVVLAQRIAALEHAIAECETRISNLEVLLADFIRRVTVDLGDLEPHDAKQSQPPETRHGSDDSWRRDQTQPR